MQFLYPGFLWALLALALPIILHLFFFRRYKKVYFSNVRFLREIKEETSARNKLRNLLILLARCLALAFLVFAFAQPFIPVADTVYQGKKRVSLFVDNSFSMQSFGAELPLLDRARQRAREIIAAYSDEDELQILTHELTAAEQRFLSREQAMNALEDIEITAEVSPLSRVVDRQYRTLTQDNDALAVSYLLSDFQKSITDFHIPDSSLSVNLVPVQSVQEKNVSIDTAWFDTPAQIINQTSQLVVGLTNHSTDDLENVKLTAEINGQEKPLRALNFTAGQTVYDTANITILETGWHEVVIRITDFPVQFDDTYYLTFYVDEDVRILSINGDTPNPRLVAAFANNPYYQLVNQSIGQLNFSELPGYDLIILNEITVISGGLTEELYRYIDGGGKVLFFPAPERSVDAYDQFLQRCNAQVFEEYVETERRVGSINTEEFLFSDVFLNARSNIRMPVVQASYTQSSLQRTAAEPIMIFRDGSSFLTKYPIGRGYLLVCAAPLDLSVNDLSKQAEIFIPLLYRSALSTGQQSIHAYVIGGISLIEVNNLDRQGDRVVTFRGPSEFIPGILPLGSKTLLDPGDQIAEAGFYELISQDSVVGVYGFNYDRQESNLAYFTPQELRDRYGDSTSIWEASAQASFTERVAQQDRGIRLWRWCIILALAFLALEILLIRVWKS